MIEVNDSVYPSSKDRKFDIGRVQQVGPQEAFEGGWFRKADNARVSDEEVDKAPPSQWDEYQYRGSRLSLQSGQAAVLWGGCGCGGNGPRIENVSDLTRASEEIANDYYSKGSVPEGHFR